MNTTDLEAWPFLVSRNKQMGYRPVVAPDFLVNAKSTSVLSDAAGGDITKPGYLMYRQIHNTKEGDLTIIFRVTDAIDDNDLLRDSFGRPITWITGFVFRGRLEQIAIGAKDFEKVYGLVSSSFQEFWRVEANFDVHAAPSLIINHSPIAKDYKLRTIDPHIVLRSYSSAKRSYIKPGESITWNVKHTIKFDLTIQSIVFGPKEPILAILMGHAKYVLLLNYGAKEWVGPFKLLNSSDFGAIRFTPNGNYIGIVDNSPYLSLKPKNKVWLWDVKKQKNVSHTKQDDINRVWDIDFSPDGQFLSCGGDEGYLYLWNLLSNEWEATLLAHRKPTTCIRFSRDSSVISTGSQDGTIALWKLSGGKVSSFSHRLDTHEDTVNQIEFSPKGNILASASDDSTIRIWDWQRTDEIAVLSAHAPVKTLSFSPDGRLLASAGQDGVIYVWDIHAQDIVSTLTEHKDSVFALAFSPDGRSIFSGGLDKKLIWWERENF